MYNACLFDLDGTLLNTLEDLALSVAFALKRQGMPPRSEDEIRSFVGNGVERLVRLSVPPHTPQAVFERCFADFKAYYAAHSRDKTAPYPGITELLGELKRGGIKIGVVSNKYQQAVSELCAAFFPGLTDCAVGERRGVARKPAPDCVFEAVRIMGCDIEKTLYIGDSEVDIQTAGNAGVKCAAVLWGFRDEKTLISAGADYTAARAEDIIRLVKG